MMGGYDREDRTTRRERWRRVGVACFAVVGVALVGASAGCSSGDDAVAVGGTFQFVAPGGQTDIYYPPDERQPVGDLQGPSLEDPNRTLRLSDFDGQVVVLNVWGQWCGPCRSEIDDLERVQDTIAPRNATVLGINVRDGNRQLAKDFMVDNAMSYPSIYDPPFKSAVALGGFPATVIPTTIVLDRQHRPASVFLREVTDHELLDAVNKEL